MKGFTHNFPPTPSGNTRHGKVYHHQYFCEQNDYMDEGAFKLYEMKSVDSVEWLVHLSFISAAMFSKYIKLQNWVTGFL